MITSDSGGATYHFTLSEFLLSNFAFFGLTLLAAALLLAFSYAGLHANYAKSRQDLYILQGANEEQKEKLAAMNLLSQSVEEKMIYVDLLETKILKLVETDGNTSDPAVTQIDARLKELDTQGLYGVAEGSDENGYMQYYTAASLADELNISSDLSSLAEKLEQKESLIASKEKNFEKLESTWITNSDFAQCYPDFSPTVGRITDYMGYRTYPRTAYHKGLDIGNDGGTPIHAAGRGTITQSGWNGDYGYCVQIDHGYGYSTLYGHNSKLLVKAGDKIEKGDVIALMGSTGYSTGNHCHFEVHENGKLRNPLDFVAIKRDIKQQ
jgi:murein DD-endopeptidase MepM/ murein hydrolase activator NlpD